VGTNRRYADRIDREAIERMHAEVMARGIPPLSLNDLELELKDVPLTKPPRPREVSAWVHYGAVAIFIDCEAVAWTEHAVAIRWITPQKQHHRAWVWSSAVRPRGSR
jgi:hypothetical protein